MSYHGRFEPEQQPKKKRGMKFLLVILKKPCYYKKR